MLLSMCCCIIRSTGGGGEGRGRFISPTQCDTENYFSEKIPFASMVIIYGHKKWRAHITVYHEKQFDDVGYHRKHFIINILLLKCVNGQLSHSYIMYFTSDNEGILFSQAIKPWKCLDDLKFLCTQRVKYRKLRILNC